MAELDVGLSSDHAQPEVVSPSSCADATRRSFCDRSLDMAHIKVCQQWLRGRLEPGIRVTVMACTTPSHLWHLQSQVVPAGLCACRVPSQAVHVQDCSGTAQELVALGTCRASLVQAPHMTTVTPELGCWADVAAGIAGQVVADSTAAEQGYCAWSWRAWTRAAGQLIHCLLRRTRLMQTLAWPSLRCHGHNLSSGDSHAPTSWHTEQRLAACRQWASTWTTRWPSTGQRLSRCWPTT